MYDTPPPGYAVGKKKLKAKNASCGSSYDNSLQGHKSSATDKLALAARLCYVLLVITADCADDERPNLIADSNYSKGYMKPLRL